MNMHADSQEKKPTKDQQAVIDSIDRSCAVVAGAGSGKTMALVGRCLRIVEKNEDDLERILAITFTEKAAGELKKRLRAKLPSFRHRIESAWIGTFHSCFARILRQSAPLIGLDPSFKILDENSARMLTGECAHEELLSMLEAKDADAVRLVDALEFKTALLAMHDLLSFRWHARNSLAGDVEASDEERAILKSIKGVYLRIEEALMHRFSRLNATDFQGLEILVLELFKKHPEVLEQYKSKFTHILVDEFQDTNDLQTEFVLGLHSPKQNRLCIVGDPRQSIYRFRGANVDCFAKALQVILKNKGTKFELKENFRSAARIVDFVNGAQSVLADGLFGSLTAQGIGATAEAMIASAKNAGKAPELVQLKLALPPKTPVASRRFAEGHAIAGAISRMISDEGIEPQNIALLFRALTDTTAYELALKSAGVPYMIFGGRGFLERQEISDIMAVLLYAADQSNNAALLQILRSPLVGLSDDELLVMAGESGNDLRKNCEKDHRCAIISELCALARHLKPSEILRRAVTITGYEEICSRLDPSGGMTANLDRFISLASTIEREEPTTLKAFAEFVLELRERSARMGDPPAAGDSTRAVKIMTIHAAKGLEFPVVILPELFRRKKPRGGHHFFSRSGGMVFKLKDPLHPFADRDKTERYEAVLSEDGASEDAESKRLLYVAMTRAMDRLILPTHDEPESSWTWMQYLSPIAAEFSQKGMLHVAEHDQDQMHSAVIPEDLATSTNTIRSRSQPQRPPHVVTVSELECFARCPREYSYKYVLQIPACFTSCSGETREEAVERRSTAENNAARPPANVLGSIVHGVLERYVGDRNTLKAMVDSSCIANRVMPSSWIHSYVTRAIENLDEHPLGRKIGEGRREVRFDWKVGDTIVTGSIDWLIAAGDKLAIVDFKTDAVPAGLIPEKAAEYELQMACYALAAEAATAKKVSSTTLMFLCAGETHEVQMDEERRMRSMKLIEDSIKGLTSGISDAIKSSRCDRCPYSEKC